MSITTRLYIGSVGWNNKYSHVVNFASHSERSGYFASRFTLLGTTRLLDREHGTLELELEYTTLIREKYNYLWVQEVHEEHTYEWFAFITAVSRNAKNTAIVNYEVDYWQTYFFDKDGNKAVFNIKDAFIQREHQDRWAKAGVNNMTPIYSRTIEGLEVGDKVVTEQKVLRNYLIEKSTSKKTNLYLEPYLVIVNRNFPDPSGVGGDILYSRNNGIGVNNLSYLLYFIIKQYVDGDAPYEVYYNLDKPIYFNDGYADRLLYQYGLNFEKPLGNKMTDMNDPRVLGIKKLSYLPFRVTVETLVDKYVLDFSALDYFSTGVPSVMAEQRTISGTLYELFVPLVAYRKLNGVTLHQFNTVVETRLTTNMSAMEKYEPKLLTQEFLQYKVNNAKTEPLAVISENTRNTTTIVYNNTLDFFAQNDLFLKNYNDSDFNYRVRHDTTNEQIIMTDAFKSYILANRNQIAVTEATGVVSAGLGVASIVVGASMLPTNTGMGIGLIAGGIAGLSNSSANIGQSLAKKEDYRNKVDEVKANVNTLGLDLSTSGDAYRLTKYEIRPTYKSRVYELFKKQGYLSNEYKVPNLTSRYYFNYIKCGYVELDPQAIGEDAVRKIIEGIYLNGTTIWHYRNSPTFNLLDYSKENVEMSLLS